MVCFKIKMCSYIIAFILIMTMYTVNANAGETELDGIDIITGTSGEQTKSVDVTEPTEETEITEPTEEVEEQTEKVEQPIGEEPVEEEVKPEPFVPETLKKMKDYDYISESTTGLSKKLQSLKTLQKKVTKYGKLYYDGMPYDEYKDAMTYKWKDCTDYKNEPVKISVDINKTLNHSTYVDILKKLSRYDGVYMYKIGEANSEKRNIYAIEIDVESKYDKEVIMLTGNVHAREFAGGTFNVKMLVDLVQKAQTDKKTMDILKKYKFVSVPIINVDMRSNIISNQSKWTTKGGEIWKAYENGTDGNRNFPGLAWGQVSWGNKLKWNIEPRATYANYMGDYAGSNNETKALMKWLYHYVVVEKAKCLLDLHQQGRVVYAGKGWSTKKQEENADIIRKNMIRFLNKGNGYGYKKIEDEPKYGLAGTGSTITDYACAVAFGAKFSPAYGYHVMTDGKKEYTLLEFNDMDKLKFKPGVPNNDFVTLTLEIGYGKGYLGNSASTRKRLAKEYEDCNFDKLLESLPEMID